MQGRQANARGERREVDEGCAVADGRDVGQRRTVREAQALEGDELGHGAYETAGGQPTR